jgi:hypothetical protein
MGVARPLQRFRQPHPHLIAHEFQITGFSWEYSGFVESFVHYGAHKSPRSPNLPRSFPGWTYHAALVHQRAHRYPRPRVIAASHGHRFTVSPGRESLTAARDPDKLAPRVTA